MQKEEKHQDSNYMVKNRFAYCLLLTVNVNAEKND